VANKFFKDFLIFGNFTLQNAINNGVSSGVWLITATDRNVGSLGHNGPPGTAKEMEWSARNRNGHRLER